MGSIERERQRERPGVLQKQVNKCAFCKPHGCHEGGWRGATEEG